MIKKFFSLLLTLCMVLAMMPVVAKADTPASTHVESVKIGTAELNSDRPYYHNGESGAQGEANDVPTGANATFDAENGTLTLNGLDIETDQKGICWEYNKFTGAKDLKIFLGNGTRNIIKNDSGSGIVGDFGYLNNGGASLAIEGNGTLEVTGKNNGIWVWQDITIQGGAKVEAKGTNLVGICNHDSTGTITIRDSAVVTATGKTYGIGYDSTDDSYFNVPVIQGGTVTMTGGTAAVRVKGNNTEPSPDLDEYTGGCKVYVGESADGRTEWTNSQPLKDYKYIYIVPGDHEHSFDSTWSHNDTYHWQKCTHNGCSMTNGYVVHSYGESGITCSTCGYDLIKIDSVNIAIAEPEAGVSFATNATVDTTGVSTTNPDIIWKKGNTSVSGPAGYNTAYTACVTLTPNDGYVFDSSVTATINGNSSQEDVVTKNGDGTITVSFTFPSTRKANITSITPPTAITGVTNGTSKDQLGLPGTVTISTEDSNITTATVTWDLNSLTTETYDPQKLTAQTFSVNGTVNLPVEIANGTERSLSVTIQVTVNAADQVASPTADPGAGTYDSAQSVTLSSATAGADIYYTTDGTTPSSSSTKYEETIDVSGIAGQSVTTTIKAIAVKEGMRDSAIATFTYTITIPVPTYSVTFDSKGGTSVEAQHITSDGKVTKPDDPQKAGYTFGGWYVSGIDTAWNFDLDTVTENITLYAKWLSKDAGVTSVSVSGTAGSISGAAITVVLPYGSVIPTSASEITINTAGVASHSEPVTNDGGSTWTFTVTAEDGTTQISYTIHVSVAENPAAGNLADVTAAKTIIGNHTWTVAQGTANSKETVKTWIEQSLSGMNLNGVNVSVTMSDSFAAAIEGTSDNSAGTNGSFGFTVTLSKGTGDTSASESVTLTSGVITATAYSSGGGSNPGGNPGGSSGGNSNTGDYYIPPTTTNNDNKTENTTLPDGTKVETSTTTDKTTGATTVEEKKTALDGTVTETKTTTQKDGSSETTSKETRTDGSTTEINTNVDTEGTAKSVVWDKEVTTGDVLVIQKTEEPDGQVSYVLATLETEDATVLKSKVERAEALANMKNIPYRVKVLDENGKLDYKVRVNTGDVKANQTLYVYKYDSKTKSFGLVQADYQKVKADEKANIICDFENLISTQRYQLVTKSKAGLLDKKILATVKAKIGQKSLKVNQSTSFKLDEKLNLENVSTIKYSTSDKQVVKVSKAGKITGKNTGTADIKATITLINGKTKTVRMKIKVK